MAFRLALVTSALLVLLGSGLNPVAALQNTQRAADIELPPISWLCPMNGMVMADGSVHEHVYDDKAGSCPICKMALTSARLDSIWTCPVHSVIAEREGGLCPIGKRELVQVIVSVAWTCAANPEIEQITPGQCPDGSAMTVKYTQRPHGNHNPQHGGQFFMAPDNWTHLEGTFPEERTVRIYLYDDYTKSLPREKFTPVQGRIITKTTVGSATREHSFPLAPARNGQYLEARVDTGTLPASMIAKIRLKPDGPEHHFDFTFTEFTKEPATPAAAIAKAPTPAASTAARTAPAAAGGTAAASARTPPPAPPTVTNDPSAAPSPQAPATAVRQPPVAPPAAAGPSTTQTPTSINDMVNPALVEVAIPATVEEIVTQITTRSRDIGELITAGRFADVWLPAFEAKDLTLALNGHSAEMPTYRRRLLEPALKRLLRAAWMLDAFGDLGNREQVTAAYGDFTSAVSAIQSLMQGARQP